MATLGNPLEYKQYYICGMEFESRTAVEKYITEFVRTYERGMQLNRAHEKFVTDCLRNNPKGLDLIRHGIENILVMSTRGTGAVGIVTWGSEPYGYFVHQLLGPRTENIDQRDYCVERSMQHLAYAVIGE